MAEKAARVRLMLSAGGFLGGLDQVTAKVAATGAKMSAALSAPLRAGVASARAEIGRMGGQLKSTLSTAVKLGGVFAVGAAAKKGLELQDTYKDLAFNISMATGKAIQWESVQRTVETAAGKTSRRSGEMADAYKRVFAATGDLEYSAKSLTAIGTAATASGKPVEGLAEAAQILRRKFGASVGDLPNMLAVLLEKADAGGASFDQIIGSFDQLAGEAKRAGMEGSVGLSQVLGMLQALDAELGAEQAAMGMRLLFQYMKDNTTQMVRFQKAAHVKFQADTTPLEKIRVVLEKGAKARKEFLLTMGRSPEARNVFEQLIKPFDEAVKRAQEEGKDAGKAQLAGLDAFDASLQQLSRATATGASLAEAAAKRAEDPQRKLAMAMETFATEFTKPDALEAMGSLAKSLPKVAAAMAKLASFTINNPALAVGGYAAARVGLSFAGGALTNAGTTIGTAAAVQIRASAAAMGPWKVAGAALGIAAAAYIVYKLGQISIDELFKGRSEEASGLAGAAAAGEAAAVSKSTSTASKKKALATLEAKIEAAEQGKKGRREGWFNKATFGAYADVAETASGGDDQLAKARAAARRLRDELSGKRKSIAEQPSTAVDEAKIGKAAGDAAGKAAGREAGQAIAGRTLRVEIVKMPTAGGGTSGGGTNGLPPSPGNQPGSTPR